MVSMNQWHKLDRIVVTRDGVRVETLCAACGSQTFGHMLGLNRWSGVSACFLSVYGKRAWP